MINSGPHPSHGKWVLDGGVSIPGKQIALDLDEFRMPNTVDRKNTKAKGAKGIVGQNIAQSLSSVSAMPALKVIARCVYPIASEPPSEHARPAQPLPRPMSLPALLSAACTCLKSFFIDDEPGIIEYSSAQIAKKVKIRVEAQAVEPARFESAGAVGATPQVSADPQQTEKALATLVFLCVEDGNGSGLTRKVPVVAKPKRVRQILVASGVRHVTENAYEKEIKGALKGLQKKVDAAASKVEGYFPLKDDCLTLPND